MLISFLTLPYMEGRIIREQRICNLLYALIYSIKQTFISNRNIGYAISFNYNFSNHSYYPILILTISLWRLNAIQSEILCLLYLITLVVSTSLTLALISFIFCDCSFNHSRLSLL